MTPSETAPSSAADAAEPTRRDFIRQIIRDDLDAGRRSAVHTRFPPEPNGYLHIGHAKSLVLNFGIAEEFNGTCNLRFDDTNPAKEDPEYVEAIKDDVTWLGFRWHELRHASDYFEVFYLAAEKLIRDGVAFVCDLSAEAVRDYRGTLTEPGRESPFRARSVEENLDLFRRMRAGEFPDGARTLRAKIDMASGNINMRDPAIYRIKHVSHQNTGDAWCLYPMYDYAHCLSDAIEGITHSLCTLEFEDHRPLYDWFVDHVDLVHHRELLAPLDAQGWHEEAAKPRQIEFSRLNIDFTVMSKRKLIALVQEKLVDGWDDPRMPTLQGLRRRGYTPSALRLFAHRIGISKQNSVTEFGLLEQALRDDLDAHAQRRMGVVQPLKLVLTNLDADHDEVLSFPNHPKDPSMGERAVPFSREVWIEQDDFAEIPPKGFHRLRPDGEVRLRGVGIVRCHEVIKEGDIVVAVHCTLDPDTRPGMPGADRKVKGTIHWVAARHAVSAEIRLYDRLFSVSDPDDEDDGGPGYRAHLNPESKRIVRGWVEPAAAALQAEHNIQFERIGYFVTDRKDHASDAPVFNRSVSLRDTWAAKAK